MTIRGRLRVVGWYGDPDVVAVLCALCPGCGYEHSFFIDDRDGTEKRDTWEFDGDYDNPTFTPSMLVNKDGWRKDKPLCHSFLTKGKWHFLSDSTHELAGQTVDMVPIDESMGVWDRRGMKP